MFLFILCYKTRHLQVINRGKLLSLVETCTDDLHGGRRLKNIERRKMERSCQVLKEVIEKVGAKMVAPELNVSSTLIFKWWEEVAELPDGSKASSAPNPLDRIIRVYEPTVDGKIINRLCQSAGGCFVENIDSNKHNLSIDMTQNIQCFIEEFLETLDAVVQSYNNDNDISDIDAQEIRKEWKDLKRTGESFVRAFETGKFNFNNEKN